MHARHGDVEIRLEEGRNALSTAKGPILGGLGLFLGGPVLHPMFVTRSKKSNWMPRDVTGNEGGGRRFLSENVLSLILHNLHLQNTKTQ